MDNQDRIAAFMAYPETKVMHDGREYTVLGIIKESDMPAKICLQLSQIERVFYATTKNIDKCHLLLTDLAQITDEHVAELAALSIEVDPEVQLTEEIVRGAHADKSVRWQRVTAYIIDKMRQWGYAVPFRGKCLVAEGIAVLTTKNNDNGTV